MSKIAKCNPNVYIRAAELIASDKENFSCLAIQKAAGLYGFGERTINMYDIQYKAMFGPYRNTEIKIRHDGYPTLVADLIIKANNHPYWNKWNTPERKEYRIQALLLMAEMCRNPNV